MTKAKSEVVYAIRPNGIEVRIEINGVEVDDEVTFLVSNTDSIREALRKVKGLIKAIRESKP